MLLAQFQRRRDDKWGDVGWLQPHGQPCPEEASGKRIGLCIVRAFPNLAADPESKPRCHETRQSCMACSSSLAFAVISRLRPEA
jgi:hypothetical protein